MPEVQAKDPGSRRKFAQEKPAYESICRAMTAQSRLPTLYVHEWVYGGFLAITAVRLLANDVALLGTEFALMAAGVPLIAGFAVSRSNRFWEIVRLAWCPALIGPAYFRLGDVVKQLGNPLRDDNLLAIDRLLFGETPAVAWIPWNHPVLTEFMSLCYFLFYPAIAIAFAAGILRKHPKGVRFFDGFITIQGIGFLSYTILPAAGPHLAYPDLFPVAAEVGWISEMNALAVSGSNGVDVFPSLHTAVTVFLMGTLWRISRRWFWTLLVPAIGLCLATLYLRYHYAVDVIAGIGLAAFALWLANRANGIASPR
jgi:membrane-associated phospholipid phosphatase